MWNRNLSAKSTSVDYENKISQSPSERQFHLGVVVSSLDYLISHRQYLVDICLKREWKLTVIFSRSSTKNLQLLSRQEISLVQVPIFSGSMNPFKELWYFFESITLLREFRPDVLHLVGIKQIAYGGIWAYFKSVKNVIYTFAGLGFSFDRNEKIFSRGSIKRLFAKSLLNILLRFS